MCWSLSYATDDVTCIRIMELIGLGRSYQMTPSYKIGLTTSHSVVYIANNKHLGKGQYSAMSYLWIGFARFWKQLAQVLCLGFIKEVVVGSDITTLAKL